MKSVSFLLAIVLLVGLPLAVSADAYNKSVVVATMRGFAAKIGTVKTAVAARDFVAAAQALYDYGKSASDLAKMDPPKGSAEDWTRTWNLFQDKAFMGVGACGERDAAKVLKTLDELVALNKFGHPAFRF
jgi:hypothetical protein